MKNGMLKPKSSLNQDLVFLRFLLIVLIASFLFIKYCTGTARAEGYKENSAAVNQDSLNIQDAIILTLRSQDGILLDTLMQSEISKVLQAARNQYDTLQSIHAFPDYVANQLMLKSDAAWTQAWYQGELLTGNPAIDSLTALYQMTAVDIHSFCFVLNFAQPLKMTLLAAIYEKIPGVIFAEPNGYIGDGDNIEWFKKNNTWHLAFSHGWGDCPAGCINRYYWYVTINENLTAQLIEEKERDFREPYIFLWNVPPRYAATIFTSADDLLAIAQYSSDWWIRRHAIEVIGRLFIYEDPWVSEDLENLGLFESIRNVIRSNRQYVIEMLIQLLNDPDPDVRASAQWALNKSLGLAGGTLAYYFPMQVGNRWLFFPDNPTTDAIIDTIRINGNLYYQFDEYRHYPNTYLRMSSDNKLYHRFEDYEQLWLDFSADVGDSWIINNQSNFTEWTVFLQSKTDTINVPAGTFTNCCQFWFRFEGMDNDWVEWYAPGVGPVKRILYGYGVIDYTLENAVVNGLHYPTIFIPQVRPDLIDPTQFALLPNYPNPFNATTTLNYVLKKDCNLSLKIYNILGEEVITLIDEPQQPGYKTAVWDAKDCFGKPVSSGIYFCIMKAGDFNKSQKILLMR
jgi:hypothetical protein